ncbi:hypothetical protein Dimus_001904 [Dionaea muscipula]
MAHNMYVKKQTAVGGTCGPTARAAMGVHMDSRVISKVRPKIRIIHIFAPEIIKTDVASFRELVQRLTGKPSETGSGRRPRSAGGGKGKGKGASTRRISTTEKIITKKDHFDDLGRRHHHVHYNDQDQGLWRGDGSAAAGGGFLTAFADVECFMQGIGDFRYPLVSMESNGNVISSSAAAAAATAANTATSLHFNGFEGTQLISFKG